MRNVSLVTMEPSLESQFPSPPVLATGWVRLIIGTIGQLLIALGFILLDRIHALGAVAFLTVGSAVTWLSWPLSQRFIYRPWWQLPLSLAGIVVCGAIDSSYLNVYRNWPIDPMLYGMAWVFLLQGYVEFISVWRSAKK